MDLFEREAAINELLTGYLSNDASKITVVSLLTTPDKKNTSVDMLLRYPGASVMLLRRTIHLHRCALNKLPSYPIDQVTKAMDK